MRLIAPPNVRALIHTSHLHSHLQNPPPRKANTKDAWATSSFALKDHARPHMPRRCKHRRGKDDRFPVPNGPKTAVIALLCDRSGRLLSFFEVRLELCVFWHLRRSYAVGRPGYSS